MKTVSERGEEARSGHVRKPGRSVVVDRRRMHRLSGCPPDRFPAMSNRSRQFKGPPRQIPMRTRPCPVAFAEKTFVEEKMCGAWRSGSLSEDMSTAKAARSFSKRQPPSSSAVARFWKRDHDSTSKLTALCRSACSLG